MSPPQLSRPPEKELLDSQDVSRILGLGRTKVFAMMARAELPVVRIGRLVRVPRSALMAWIESETACQPGPRRATRSA